MLNTLPGPVWALLGAAIAVGAMFAIRAVIQGVLGAIDAVVDAFWTGAYVMRRFLIGVCVVATIGLCLWALVHYLPRFTQ